MPDRIVRVRDLAEYPPYGVFLNCPICGERCSATRADYVMAAPDQPLVCTGQPDSPHAAVFLRLVGREER
jgi:hypothetical protein